MTAIPAPRGALAFVPADVDRPSRWIYSEAELVEATEGATSVLPVVGGAISAPLRAASFADVLDLSSQIESVRLALGALGALASSVLSPESLRPSPPSPPPNGNGTHTQGGGHHDGNDGGND